MIPFLSLNDILAAALVVSVLIAVGFGLMLIARQGHRSATALAPGAVDPAPSEAEAAERPTVALPA